MMIFQADVTAVPGRSGRNRPGSPAGHQFPPSGNDMNATLMSLEQHQSGIHVVADVHPGRWRRCSRGSREAGASRHVRP